MSKRTSGEGTIYQRANGLWCGELTIGYDSNGKRIKKSFSSMNLEKLQKKMNDEKFMLNRNMITVKSDYTVAEWVQFWLENYKANTLKAKTYDNYEYALNSHIRDAIGHYKLDKLRPEMIQQLYNGMVKRKLSTSTINKVHITLNQAMEQAVKNALIHINPCKATTVPKTAKKRVTAMTAAEQDILVNHCSDSVFHLFFIFLLNTGLRCGEGIALTWNDVDLNNKFIVINKTASLVVNRTSNAKTKRILIVDTAKTEDSERNIPINKHAEQVLKTLQALPYNEKYVFSTKTGNMLSERNVSRSLSALLQRANLPNTYAVHTLRHSFATRLLEKGANPKVVSEILGHASIQITLDIYSHVMPNLKKDVISLLD